MLSLHVDYPFYMHVDNSSHLYVDRSCAAPIDFPHSPSGLSIRAPPFAHTAPPPPAAQDAGSRLRPRPETGPLLPLTPPDSGPAGRPFLDIKAAPTRCLRYLPLQFQVAACVV